MRTLSLALAIGWLVSSAAVAETTITFDPRPAGNRVGIEGYTEGGMVFDDSCGTFDPQGIWTWGATVPPGIAGVELSFHTFALGRITGKVVITNEETVSFQ